MVGTSTVSEKQRLKQLLREWDALVEPLTTPIVYHPGGWEASVPSVLKGEVLRQRLEKLKNGGWDEATDAEVLCYLYTASLIQPLTSDWTQIYLYQTSQWRPELRDIGIDVPEELTEYQNSELRHLKRNIRDSQLRRRKNKKKEANMSNRKLVMEERDGKVLVGIQQEGCDPIVTTVDGDLYAALAQVNGMLAGAQEKWATAPKNPAYKPPAPPKPAAAPAPKAEDLPLLAGQEKPQATAPAAETKPEAVGIHVPEEGNLAAGQTPAPSTEAPTEEPTVAPTEEPTVAPTEPVAAEEAEAGTEEKVTETTGTPAAETPGPEAPAAEPEPSPEPEEEKPEAPAAPEPELVQALPKEGATEEAQARDQTTMTEAAKAPTGEWQYWLKDGRGPFTDIQAAMDGMGMDKENRPHHNRWDRLSTALKEQIQRRQKA